MNLKHLLLSLLFCMLWAAGFAAETEPNDSRAQATKLNLNSSNTGAIGTATDVDWWKVTTTSDGRIDLTLTVSNGLYCWYDLYDNNATTLLHSSYTNGTQSYSQDGLAVGTYYIHIHPFTAGQLPSYTLANALVVASPANDAEPNGLYTQAGTLALNGSVTGHIGYYFNLTRDTTDWWKVTTTGDGLLNLSLSIPNGQYVYWELYDANGTTNLNGTYTSGTGNYNSDGLATGTYYVKIHCFYTDGYAPYTLSCTFTAPPVANDVEPNNTKAQAKVLPLNNSKTGHAGYYYNGVRDTTDWWKVTTTSDGLLELTITSKNGEYVYVDLYDNNGTTLLTSNYTSTSYAQNSNGLAAGTYYIKVYCYYNYKFVSYTLADTLTTAPVANDIEPNDTKATAQTFATNSTVTGHVGYYYNVHRDTADWYKIVTGKDGQIALTITSNNNDYVYATIYDNDGTTVLESQYSSTSIAVNEDGLAAGTYYVRVYSYYIDHFEPYTLSNVLNEYVNANDGLSNETAKKAVTLNANLVTPGHVGFRSNGGSQDLVDWWKINYTGSSGALTVALNWEPRFCCGPTYVYLTIYSDTNATPIFDTYSNGGNVTANLTALAQPKYYYVKVHTYYTGDWAAYNLTPAWTQTNKATITLQSATVGTNCTNGSISYKCAKSSKPYAVQLYRYGLKYGSVVTVNNTNAFSISSLPPGNYYATVFGDGATGSAKGTSATSTIVPAPTNTSTTMIKKNKANLNWDTLSCIKYDSIYYRVQGSPTWTKLKTATSHGSYTLNGLIAGTTYEWKVANVDTGNLQIATSAYTAIVNFTTLPPKMGEDETMTETLVSVYPNPTSALVHVSFENQNEGMTTIRLMDMTGKVVMSKTGQSAAGSLAEDLDLSKLSAGMYTIQIITADGNVINRPVIKAKD